MNRYSMENSTSEHPLVSTVSATINGIKYIEKALECLINQSYPNIEHVFVDGGSTDGTVEFLAKYQARYPNRIRFISEVDRGVGEAMNKGFALAKGEILGWVDPDSFLELDAINVIARFFRTNPQAYVVFGRSRLVNEAGTKILYTRPIRDWNREEAIKYRHFITYGAAFYRREVIERTGGFDIRGNDLDFWLRVDKIFKIYRIDDLLCNTRVRSDSLQTSKSGALKKRQNEERYKDYLLCRQQGGSILSAHVRNYWIARLLVATGLYSFAYKVTLQLRGKSPVFEKIWMKFQL
jgi:glycosyltransferase involved in cell wall biosynthesis